MSEPRHLIVVDCETNGLDVDRHQAVEVAWWDLETDKRGVFIPNHDRNQVLATAEIKALQINRYVDRIADQPQDEGWGAALGLWERLDGNTLGGSNPRFDAHMLSNLFVARHRGNRHARLIANPAPWHHRLWDLSSYAAGVLGLTELPGLAQVCELLDVEPGDHTAEADVTATGLCFRKLMRKAAAS